MIDINVRNKQLKLFIARFYSDEVWLGTKLYKVDTYEKVSTLAKGVMDMLEANSVTIVPVKVFDTTKSMPLALPSKPGRTRKTV